MIPSQHPKAQYLAHQAEIDEAIRRVLAGSTYLTNESVAAFESEMAGWLGLAHAVGVSSGTEAIRLALCSHLIGRDDEVIVAAHGPVSAPAAVELAGARPVFADVEGGSFALDPESVRALITSRTRAVIVTHLYGHPAELERLATVCRKHRLLVIEDCAGAPGATVGGRKVGTFAHVSTFSFHPTKPLGALGDGGLLATDDPQIARRCRQLREFGWNEHRVSEIPGGNFRLDELQAAVLRVKLAHLEAGNEHRRRIAALYHDGLSELPLRLPRARPGTESIYHRYVIRAADREALRERLTQVGIEAVVPFPIPLHRHPAYRDRLGEASLPAAERASSESLALPMYPELGDAEVRRVIEALRACFDSEGRKAS